MNPAISTLQPALDLVNSYLILLIKPVPNSISGDNIAFNRQIQPNEESLEYLTLNLHKQYVVYYYPLQ